MMFCESISEIGLRIQGYHQGQMSWSMSCKLVHIWQTSVKSATLGFTNSKCWLPGLSLNDVFLIIFLKLDLGSKIIFKIQDAVDGPVYLI